MKKIDLSFLLGLDIKQGAIVLDERFMGELDNAINALIDFKIQAVKVRAQAGGKLPDNGLLVIGSAAFDSREPSTNCVVHSLDSFRTVRRKRK